ncbi:MAG: hypothetical protein VXV85_00060 [Candidatus Thermoplasmatota archaeon]|nr:hypothetical protein [Candidatus Thermoplasmatota archaeon]
MKFIESTVSLNIVPKRGQLIHPLFGEVVLWRQHEFHSWWNLFETIIDHPLSRTLINGFVDSLEVNSPMPQVGGLFRKKKFKKESDHIGAQLGWGSFQLEKQKVFNSAHPLLSVALGQYFLEAYHRQRFKVRWVEPRPQIVQIETESSPDLPHPKPLEPLPWSTDDEVKIADSSLIVDQHSKNELRFEGERVVLIPIESMERFLLGCLPYVPQQDVKWFDANSCEFNTLKHLLRAIIQSISGMFLKSEQPVYIIDESSWTAYIENYICERGWGDAQVTDYDSADYTLELTMSMQSQFPFTVGLLCGMWERAHGRGYRLSLHPQTDTFVVKIQSLLEYENQ